MAERFRTFIDLRKEFPDKLGVELMFLDLNQDGKLDALASSYGEKYQDGWNWYAFSQDNKGKWKPFTRPKKPIDDNTIFARPDTTVFYSPKK